MKIKVARYLVIVITSLLIISLFNLSSCVNATSQTSSFYDAGSNNFTATGSDFVQYFLYRFDTSASSLSFITPAAADVVPLIQSPVAGEIIVFGVTADGGNKVTLIGGSNVSIKPSASAIAPNSTLTVYCVFDNVASGSEAMTVY
jgi:hypothetical protein